MSDPVLGPNRTLRQHLIVAQTINSVCQTWPGAPKVAATSDGWMVSGPTGATAAVATVEALWSAVLPSNPESRSSNLHHFVHEPGAELSLRVLTLGCQLAHKADEPPPAD